MSAELRDMEARIAAIQAQEALEDRVAALEMVLAPADFSLLPLRPDEVRQLLRECVTVVKPGETLVIRVPSAWSPLQVCNYSEVLRTVAGQLDLPFQIMVVIGDELTVAEPRVQVTGPVISINGDAAALGEYFSNPENREAWRKALRS